MNEAHLIYCNSDEWAETCRNHIVPGALAGVTLGDLVLEVGPGPGRTTDILKDFAPRLVAVELDAGLAANLAVRMAGTNVTVVEADATALPFPDNHFSAAFSFTMLHHVPSPEQQDQLLAEVARVLKPGGVFAGVDSLDSPGFRALHVGDICVPIEPATVAQRLLAAGFSSATVETNPFAFQFQAVA